MPSFDIVSKTDLTEVDNAVAGVTREVAQRFDFKGSKCTIERSDETLTIMADDDLKLKHLLNYPTGCYNERCRSHLK